jgi:hypothetical protein
VTRTAWSKGLTKDTHPSLQNTSLHMTGPNNPNWKNQDVGYASQHEKLRASLPLDQCYLDRTHKVNLQMANLDHRYTWNGGDYRVLCSSCHRRYDLGLVEVDGLSIYQRNPDYRMNQPMLIAKHIVKHGCLNGYTYYRCRCDLCRAANAQYARDRRKILHQMKDYKEVA